ncbi:hypothetical protein INT48_001914, partial [Thamnidium elegans]
GDVVDWFANEDGRHTSMSGNQTNKSNHYSISLHSIDDDELRMFHRDLVTPAPSVCYDDDMISRNMLNQRPIPARPASRTESVMLFKKINNGDEVVSFDLVSSDLRDFLDTDFMMDSILSRPVSRTTISKNASKIQDINKFRNTLQKRNDLLPKKKLEPSPLRTVVKDTTAQRDDSSKRYNNYSYITPPKTYKKNQIETVPSLRPKAFTRSFASEPVPEQRLHGSRLRETRLSEPRLSESRLHDSRLHESRFSEPRLPELRYAESRLPEPRLPELRNPEARYFEARYTEPTRLNTEPRLTRKPRFNTDSKTSQRDRMRSETVSSSSSSEEEEFWMQRSSQLLKNIKNDPILETSGKLKPKSTQEPNYTMPSGHYSSPILHHRYSVPNNRFLNAGEQHAMEYKSLSSSRTTEVADNAKQVLAGIRERRKSAMVFESPKLEASTRFQNSQQDYTPASDFRSRLQLHRESIASHSNNLRRSQPSKYIPNTNIRRYEEPSSRYI